MTYRRLELGASCVSMAVDETSIVCGLEDGRVDVYSRANMTRLAELFLNTSKTHNKANTMIETQTNLNTTLVGFDMIMTLHIPPRQR